MTQQCINVAPHLTVNFDSEILATTDYSPCGPGCGSCESDCDDGTSTDQHCVTLHRIQNGVIECQSKSGCRKLPARFVITDGVENSASTELRAFRDEEELRDWVNLIGEEQPALGATLQRQLIDLM